MKNCANGGITRSSVPIRYQDGIVFHAGTPDFSPSTLRTSGRCSEARTAALSAFKSSAKHEGKRLGLMYKSTSTAIGTKLKTCVGSPPRQEPFWPGGGGAVARSPNDSPSSGTNASTNTRAFTFEFPVAALVMTAPPYECPTRMIGPLMVWRKLAMYAESEVKPRSGLGGA